MTPMSSLFADRNCLQVQVERSMSSASAGITADVLHASIAAAPTPAKIFMAESLRNRRPNYSRSSPQARAMLLLEVQVRLFHHVGIFDDFSIDRIFEIVGRPAAGIYGHVFELRRHVGIADGLAQRLFQLGDDRRRRRYGGEY